MSDLEKVLEKLNDELCRAAMSDRMLTVLRREILPLLEAGNRCRAHVEQSRSGDMAAEAHDAAKRAVLERE